MAVFTSNNALSICQGDSVFLDGAYRKVSGLYVDSLQTMTGCDSVISTNLTVLPSPTLSTSVSICQGDSLLIGSTWQSTSGTYPVTYSAANGCDSTVITNLTVNPSFSVNMSTSICFGDSLLVGGSYQTSTGTYVDSLSTLNGCDSVFTTQLTVIHVDTSVVVLNNTLTAQASNATFRWIDCTTNTYIPGATSATFAPTSNGLYSVEVTQSGCVDTSACIAITTIGVGENGLPVMSFHPNPTDGSVFINLGRTYGEVMIKVINANGQWMRSLSFESAEQVEVDLSDLPSGEYFLDIQVDNKHEIIKVVRMK